MTSAALLDCKTGENTSVNPIDLLYHRIAIGEEGESLPDWTEDTTHLHGIHSRLSSRQ
jgi:hypothetical protein